MAINSRCNRLLRRENAPQLPWTIWKRSFSVARKESWNRHAWRAQMAAPRRSRLYVVRQKWEEMILAHAAQGRNIRSATEQKQQRKLAGQCACCGIAPSHT